MDSRTATPEQLIEHADFLRALARALLRDEHRAEDAVQEIFVSLMSSAGRYDPMQASEATFVAMVARRRLIDRRRAAERR